MRIVPVIMCGGGGARLWPSSRPNHPKQFLRLLGEISLFQATVKRLAGQPGMLDPVIVAGAAHQGWLSEQLSEIGQSATLLLEPSPRDSGPAVAAAALHIAAQYPDAVAVVLASDHHIPSPEAFRAVVAQAVDLASEGRVVTLGVRPTSPSSAYGYIQPGPALAAGAPGLAVDRFVEKPDPATAEGYVREGYLWNSGNFVAPAALLAEEFRLHAPEVLEAVSRSLSESVRAGGVRHLSASFADAPRISFDYAVMERTSRAAVLPVDFSWSD
ncbi:MAG: mannose-1-phosphate guanylyltransferase, partial [Phenylobacterium sp.]